VPGAGSAGARAAIDCPVGSGSVSRTDASGTAGSGKTDTFTNGLNAVLDHGQLAVQRGHRRPTGCPSTPVYHSDYDTGRAPGASAA